MANPNKPKPRPIPAMPEDCDPKLWARMTPGAKFAYADAPLLKLKKDEAYPMLHRAQAEVRRDVDLRELYFPKEALYRVNGALWTGWKVLNKGEATDALHILSERQERERAEFAGVRGEFTTSKFGG